MLAPTILITGGAGYIGSHIGFACVQRGYQVIVLDSLRHQQLFNHRWAPLYSADYADQEILHNIFTQHHINAVVHCAGSIEVAQSVKNPVEFYDNNVAKTITLLQSMLEHHINTIIFSSSCAVYGIPEYYAFTEDHPKNPINPYGKSKLMIENILQDMHQAYNLRYVILRYFNAAGALPEEGLGELHNPETHVIPLLLQSAYEQKPFMIYGTDYPTKDGTAIRDYVHARDIAQAHILALEHLQGNLPSDCFNLGTGHGFSVKELVKTVERICYTEIKTVIQKRRAGDCPVLLADPTRAQTILRWQPQYSNLDFIIKSAHAFALMHKNKHLTSEIYR